jgi:hypothetical protein
MLNCFPCLGPVPKNTKSPYPSSPGTAAKGTKTDIPAADEPATDSFCRNRAAPGNLKDPAAHRGSGPARSSLSSSTAAVAAGSTPQRYSFASQRSSFGSGLQGTESDRAAARGSSRRDSFGSNTADDSCKNGSSDYAYAAAPSASGSWGTYAGLSSQMDSTGPSYAAAPTTPSTYDSGCSASYGGGYSGGCGGGGSSGGGGGCGGG